MPNVDILIPFIKKQVRCTCFLLLYIIQKIFLKNQNKSKNHINLQKTIPKINIF